MKKVITGEELKRIIKESVDLLCDTVSMTLGPKGTNAIISSSALPAFITNDGVTIARNVESDDIAINSILEILKESSIKTDELVGDGTTTTLVLLKAIIEETMKLINENMTVYEIKNELLKEEKIINEFIISESHIPNEKELLSIAITSSGSEKAGENIYEVASKIKNKMGVEIKTSSKPETKLTFYKGYSMDTNLASPYFFKDRNVIKLTNPYVIISNEKIYDLESLSEIINKSIEDNRDLIIFAQDFEESLIDNILSLNYDDESNIYLFKNPEFGKRQYLINNDLMKISNSKEFKNDFNHNDIGEFKEIVIDKDKTMIYFENEIDTYIEELNQEITELKDDFEIEFYEKRISMLKDGLALIEVGGKTLSEARELKMHYDDAINSVYSALDGINIGAGLTYLKSANILEEKSILKKVLCVPFEQILKNAGIDFESIKTEIIDNSFSKIYNVKLDAFENVDKTTVLDSTKVLTASLSNAISIAILLLMTKSLVINEQIKNIDIDHDINI